jgi:hypothetical protein
MDLAARATELPPLLSLGLFAAVLLAAALAGLGLRRRLLPRAMLSRDVGACNAALNTVGLLYTLLLAFMVVGVWGSYNRAEAATDLEASSLISVYRLAQAYPDDPAHSQALAAAARDYAACVVHREFPAMEQMQVSEEAERAAERLWLAASALDPRGARQTNIQDMVLRQLDKIDEARVTRLYAANRGIPPSLWAVALGLTVLTLALSTLITAEDPRLERALMGALALATALVIFTVVQLNYPFIGEVKVPSEGFDELIRQSEPSTTAPSAAPPPLSAKPAARAARG